jgi:uncharacterized protein (DUF2384 family)
VRILAEKVLGGNVNIWFRTPNPATHDRAPQDLVGNLDGLDFVKNLLLRIEYGVLA